jgi:polysaccharide export outer membrane protein
MKNQMAGYKGLMADHPLRQSRLGVDYDGRAFVRGYFYAAVPCRGIDARGASRFFRAATASLVLSVGVFAQQSALSGSNAGLSAAHTTQSAEVQPLREEQPRSGKSSAHSAVPSSNANTPFPVEKNEQADPNAYIIGEQDALVITVWKEKEISGGVVVRPDGKITVPLVGEIKVVGMTPVQLQSVLMEKLKPFVTVPQVTVAVTEIRSRKIYLIGHAAREGPFTINGTTSVLQIIAQAGGLKDFAKRKKIYILRQHGTEQTRFDFNYDQVIKGQHIEQNILLEPGDTIVVP